MRITLCVALLLALAVPVVAQEELCTEAEIYGIAYPSQAKSVGNQLYILIVTKSPASNEQFFVYCRATGSIKHRIMIGMRRGYYIQHLVTVRVRLRGYMRWGSYANFPQTYRPRPKYGIVIVIKHVEFDYENTISNAGR